VSREGFAKHVGIAENCGFATTLHMVQKKNYTQLIVVCTGQYLVYTWFAHLEKSCTRCYEFYEYIGFGLTLLVISDALKDCMPQNI
jgi:hypothetical protein